MSGEDDNDIPASGAVFTFGRSRFADNVPSHFFIRNDPVIDIDCGDEHTAIVCQNGRVFAFGNNEWGQLGLGHRSVVNKPSCLKSLKPEHAVHVACGKTHTLISTASGKLFACGNNSDGQLGVGDSTDRDILIETENIPGTIVQLSAGCLHSAALNNKGEVYVWGSNSDGQLGLGEGVKSVSTPTRLQLHENIAKIACGYYHSVFLTEEGQVLVCGEGECGKLGLGTNENIYMPTIVPLEAWVMFVAAGGNHTVVVAVDGNVFGWGSNYNGQLGILGASEKDVTIPTHIDSLTGTVIKQVSCGERHTAFITENAELLTCGESRHGKLGYEVNDTTDPMYSIMPSRVPRFKSFSVFKVACGGCHTIVIASTCSNNDSEYSSNVPNRHLSPSKTLHPPEPEIVSPPVSGRTTLPPLQRVHIPSSNVVDPPTEIHNNLLQTQTENHSPNPDNVHKPMVITSHDNQNSNNEIDGKDNSDICSLNSPLENENFATKPAIATVSLNTPEKFIASEGTEDKVSRENNSNKKHLQDSKLFKMLQNLIKIIYSKCSDKTNSILIKSLKEICSVRCEKHNCSGSYLMIINHIENNLKHKISTTKTAVTIGENNCHDDVISSLYKQGNTNVQTRNACISDGNEYETSRLGKNRCICNNKMERSASLEKLWLKCLLSCSQKYTKLNINNVRMSEIQKGINGFIKNCENLINGGNCTQNKSIVTEKVSTLAPTNNQHRQEKKNYNDCIPTPNSHSECIISNKFYEEISNIKINDTFNCFVKEETITNYSETSSNCKDTDNTNMKKEITVADSSDKLLEIVSQEMTHTNCLQNSGLVYEHNEKSYHCLSHEDDTISVVSDNVKTNYFKLYYPCIETKNTKFHNSPVNSSTCLCESNDKIICELQNSKKNIMINNYLTSNDYNCEQQCYLTEISKNRYQNTRESSIQNELDNQKNYVCSTPENNITNIGGNNNNEHCILTHGRWSKINELFTARISNMTSHNYNEENEKDIDFNNSHISSAEEEKQNITCDNDTCFISSSEVRSVHETKGKDVIKLFNFEEGSYGDEDCELVCHKRNVLHEITKQENSTLAEDSLLNSIMMNEGLDKRNNSPKREFNKQESEDKGLETFNKNENGDHQSQVRSGGGRVSKLLTNVRTKRSQSEVNAPYDKHQNEMIENSVDMSVSNTLPAAISNKKFCFESSEAPRFLTDFSSVEI